MLRSQLIDCLPRMRRFAHGLVRDPDQADDLVQEACERALQRQYQFRLGSRLDSWLYRIIYTRWIDRLRKAKTRIAHLTLLKSVGSPAQRIYGPNRAMDAAVDIKAALAALPEEQRAAILLVAIEGYSYAEAAAVMKIPVGTVASRVARARAALNRVSQPVRRASGRRSAEK